MFFVKSIKSRGLNEMIVVAHSLISNLGRTNPHYQVGLRTTLCHGLGSLAKRIPKNNIWSHIYDYKNTEFKIAFDDLYTGQGI
jgi:hypothetical protein